MFFNYELANILGCSSLDYTSALTLINLIITLWSDSGCRDGLEITRWRHNSAAENAMDWWDCINEMIKVIEMNYKLCPTVVYMRTHAMIIKSAWCCQVPYNCSGRGGLGSYCGLGCSAVIRNLRKGIQLKWEGVFCICMAVVSTHPNISVNAPLPTKHIMFNRLTTPAPNNQKSCPWVEWTNRAWLNGPPPHELERFTHGLRWSIVVAWTEPWLVVLDGPTMGWIDLVMGWMNLPWVGWTCHGLDEPTIELDEPAMGWMNLPCMGCMDEPCHGLNEPTTSWMDLPWVGWTYPGLNETYTMGWMIGWTNHAWVGWTYHIRWMDPTMGWMNQPYHKFYRAWHPCHGYVRPIPIRLDGKSIPWLDHAYSLL